MRRILKIVIVLYLIALGILAIYSYGFVDPNLILSTHTWYKSFHEPLFNFVFFNRLWSTMVFTSLVLSLFISYLAFYFLTIKGKITHRELKKIIIVTVGILIISFPAFSYDIFNYILTSKVIFLYKENPYLVMPIELVGDPNLAFTRAANKVALYGPSWVFLTSIAYTFSFGNIIAAIFSFKILVSTFYIGTIWLIHKLSKDLSSVVLFALSPLVLIETLVSAHNDVVMMFFALLSFYLLKQRQIILACVVLLLSTLIKYATILLIPVFLFVLYQKLKKREIDWDKVYTISALSMLFAFFSAPLREEIYSWYIIWPLSFAVLITKRKFILFLTLVLSFSTLLRYIPVLYTGNYFGSTPFIKEMVTFFPVIFFLIFWLAKSRIWQKSLR